MLLEAKYIAELIQLAINIMQDYNKRVDISDKILNSYDIDYLIERLEKLKEILLSNQTRVNLIFNLVKYIINTKG